MRIRDTSLLLAGTALLALGAHAQNQPANPAETQAQDAQGTQQSTQQERTQQSARQQSDQQERGTQQAQQQGGQQESRRMAQGSAPPIVTMLVLPVAVAGQPSSTASTASDEAMKSGCWAKLYGEENYRGDTFTLIGPVDMSNMQGPFGVDWSKVSSIEAGPKANITIYDNVNFRDRAAKVQAGQKVPELSEKLGFFEDVSSMRINCSRGTG